MKKLSVTLLLLISSVSLSHSRAEAGVGFLGIPFAHQNFQSKVKKFCHTGSNLGWLVDWFPCLATLLLGESEEHSEDPLEYLSHDHPLVTKGARTASGEFVKYSLETREAHNRQRDDYVDFLTDYVDALKQIDANERGSLKHGLSKATQIVNQILDEDYVDVFTTDAEKKALLNFLERQFSLPIKTSRD